MRSLGSSLLSGLVVASAAVLVADRADAVSPPSQSPVLSQPLVVLAARKGTRNFVPGESPQTPTVTSDDGTAATQNGRDLLEECMATWDAGTHITKSKWREICQRQIKERGAYSGSAYQAKP